MNINISLGAYPGRSPASAMMSFLEKQPKDPVLGDLSCQETQICPQNCIEILTEDYANNLKQSFPDTRFRLHANVRVLEKHIPGAHLSAYRRYRKYFQKMASISRIFDAKIYTLHAGSKTEAPWRLLLYSVKQLEDLFGISVGIEGHYPTAGGKFWLDSWEEYRMLYESGAGYVIDLSHLHILATQTGKLEIELIRDMLACDRCLEVHLSHNDGSRDQHVPLEANNPPWWIRLLHGIHPKAAVFYEGRVGV